MYIHIPFCIRKCAYCDFLSGPADDQTIAAYVEALIREIYAHGPSMKDYTVTTIFMGGGTPSILSGAQIGSIMDAIRENFQLNKDVEISMEANPGTVTREKLLAYLEAGVNRLSFGLQSANNEELKLLGRIHTYEEFLESFSLARTCGFDNLNVDLISAIPKQTLESFLDSLEKVIALSPEHISAYSLIVEGGTPFAREYGEGCPKEDELPSEEVEREIYHRTEEVLKKNGYHRYEISNYAKEGKECRHNLGYWERKEYLGIGIGSASLIQNVRYKNVDDIEVYLEHSGQLEKIQEQREELSVQAQMEEFFFLGLRKMEGVSEEEFFAYFGEELSKRYGENLQELFEQGLVIFDTGRWKLSSRGIDISNYVFGKLLEDSD